MTYENAREFDNQLHVIGWLFKPMKLTNLKSMAFKLLEDCSSEASYYVAVEGKTFDQEEFIEEFRELPCLWNTSQASYKELAVKLHGWKGHPNMFQAKGLLAEHY